MLLLRSTSGRTVVTQKILRRQLTVNKLSHITVTARCQPSPYLDRTSASEVARRSYDEAEIERMETEGMQVSSQPHPALEDVFHEEDDKLRSNLVPEPMSEVEEGEVLAGHIPVQQLHAVSPTHHPFDKDNGQAAGQYTGTGQPQASAPLNALTSGASRLPRLSDTLRGVVQSLRQRIRKLRSATSHQPEVEEHHTPAGSFVDDPAGSEYSTAYDSDTAAERERPVVGPVIMSSQDVDMSNANEGEDNELVQETAAALRQAGVRAHEALAQVQHVLNDTPDAAAEVAGNIMGRGNYHHPSRSQGGSGFFSHSMPVSPFAPKEPGSTWAGRFLSPRTSETGGAGQRTTTGGSGVFGDFSGFGQGLGGLPDWGAPKGQSEPGAALPPDAASVVAGARHNVAEGLRTASHTIRHPHETAVELAGRIIGKSGYGHK